MMGYVSARQLLLLLWLSAASAAPEGTPGGKSQAQVEQEEEDVLVLTEDNLAQALQKHQLLLVAFYAPWCEDSQALAPEYAKAAAMLKKENPALRLAKVDATEELVLSREFGITGYPVLKLFQNGNRTHPTDFTGQQDAEGITKWLKRKAGPSAVLLEDEAGVAAFLGAHRVAVVGLFHDLQDEDVRLFYDVASETPEVGFALTDRLKLFQKYHVTGTGVSVFRQDEPPANFPIDQELGLDAAELSRFITVQSLDLVMELTSKNSSKIFGARIPHHLLLFVNKTVDAQLELLSSFRDAAAAFRGQVLFVLADVNGEGAQVLHYFGLKSHDAPTIRFISIETNRKYHLATDGLTGPAIHAFCQAVLEGTVEPHLMSEEVPEDWDKHPVKILVGKTFEQVAFDDTKNVFVKFYAPWCPHSKAMAPTWEELGEKYEDHEDIVIAEMDATVNEVADLTIHAYPTLYYFPAGHGRKMTEYKSTRDLETFSTFLENEGAPPSKEGPDAAESLKEEENKTDAPGARDEL